MKLGQSKTIKREPTLVESQSLEAKHLELLPNGQTETQLGMVPSADRVQCEVCGAKFLATNKLAQHMCAHYLGQVEPDKPHQVSPIEKKIKKCQFFPVAGPGRPLLRFDLPLL